MLVPMLRRAGKSVFVHSDSFGEPKRLDPAAPLVFSDGLADVRRVDGRCEPDPRYAPEARVARFLDRRFPEAAPHAIDGIVLVDGGSDSLMAGDEEGLGDPVEDAVSVAAVAGLEAPAVRIPLSVGLGADRFNHVSDAASLRAIAELTLAGGALGAVAIEAGSEARGFYRELLHHIYAGQSFRSVLSSAILAAADGRFGSEVPPALSGGRVGAVPRGDTTRNTAREPSRTLREPSQSVLSLCTPILGPFLAKTVKHMTESRGFSGTDWRSETRTRAFSSSA